MTDNYARKLTDKYYDLANPNSINCRMTVHQAIETAVREAIIKAAEVAYTNQSHGCEGDGCNLRWWEDKVITAIKELGTSKVD